MKSQVSVLTYNVWLRPEYLFYNNQEKRTLEISKNIEKENYDIVLLQECFDKKCIKILTEKLNKIYPYIIFPHIEGTLVNSGLFVLSKYPLSNVEFYKFPRLIGADKFASKGFTKFNISIDSTLISIMLLHQQSGNSKKRYKIRQDNLSLIYKNKTDIIGGDFNTEGEEKNDLLSIFKEYNIENKIPTWKTKTLDYIMSKFKLTNYKVLDWNLSDHLPVSCLIELQ